LDIALGTDRACHVTALQVVRQDFEWNAGSSKNWFTAEDVRIFNNDALHFGVPQNLRMLG